MSPGDEKEGWEREERRESGEGGKQAKTDQKDTKTVGYLLHASLCPQY